MKTKSHNGFLTTEYKRCSVVVDCTSNVITVIRKDSKQTIFNYDHPVLVEDLANVINHCKDSGLIDNDEV